MTLKRYMSTYVYLMLLVSRHHGETVTYFYKTVAVFLLRARYIYIVLLPCLNRCGDFIENFTDMIA